MVVLIGWMRLKSTVHSIPYRVIGEMELSATVLDIKESLVVYGKVTGWCAPVLSLTVTMPVFLSTEKFLWPIFDKINTTVKNKNLETKSLR